MFRATPIIFAGLVAGGCSEFNLTNKPDGANGPAPDIVVEPASIEYGRLSSGEEEVKSFIVRNIGEGQLDVSNIVVGAGLAFSVLSGGTFELETDEEAVIEVSFTPKGADENFGQILVLSNDPDTPEATVDLLGFGAVPDLVITPGSHQFGEAFIPCGAEVDLEMRNAGSEELVITDLAYTSAGQLSVPALEAVRAQLPLILAPGEATTLKVEYVPASAGSDTGFLEVWSNDPVGIETADQNGEGAYIDEAAEQFDEPGEPAVDLIFLVDQSCSMGAEKPDFRAGIPPFMAELQTLSDWQMIQVTRSSGCNNGGILDNSVVNADTIFIDNVFNYINNANTEELLFLADKALGLTGPGQCNEGAIRPGALLHIIVASDERDQSSNTWDHWVSQYESYVSSPDYVKVSGIVDLFSACGEFGTLGPAGYLNAIEYTGGTSIDICQAGWGNQLTDIATEIVAGIRTYNLADPADPDSVVVTVNGVVTTDWDYNDANDSVTINSPPVGEGDVVDVAYNVLAECET